MSLQYIFDDSDRKTAVIIPIEQWEIMRIVYPDIESLEGDLPQWQKYIIDKNLTEIADNPQCLRPIEELFEELDREED